MGMWARATNENRLGENPERSVITLEIAVV